MLTSTLYWTPYLLVLIMLWQIPLLLTILSASQITAAPVITHKGMEGNAIASLFQRPDISDESFKSMQSRFDSSVVITDEVTEVQNQLHSISV
jgi:hypothetical protein